MSVNKQPVVVDWKKDVTTYIDNGLREALALQGKILKAVDLFDEPEDFEDSLKKIKGKTDFGIAIMELLQDYVAAQMEDVPEDVEEKAKDEDEDEDVKPTKKDDE